MRRKRWLRLLIWILPLACAVAVSVEFFLPQVRYAVMGWLRGESFYRGLPSSFYRDVIVNRWQRVGQPTGFARWRAEMQEAIGIEPLSPVYSDVFSIPDPNQIPVLNELRSDSDPDVRVAAQRAKTAVDSAQ